MPPVAPLLVLHSEARKPRLLEQGSRPPDPALQRVLAEVLADAVTRPEPVVPYRVPERDGLDETATRPAERRHQMEEIAGSLENVARLLRGRGLSALFRNEPDQLNQRLFGVIADHLAAHDSG
jgi:hypothetical protein